MSKNELKLLVSLCPDKRVYRYFFISYLCLGRFFFQTFCCFFLIYFTTFQFLPQKLITDFLSIKSQNSKVPELHPPHHTLFSSFYLRWCYYFSKECDEFRKTFQLLGIENALVAVLNNLFFFCPLIFLF